MDFAGTLNSYNTSNSEQNADERALASDWAVIGKDITRAIKHFEQKEKASTQAE